MILHTLSPLADARWDDLVAGHPRASAFHQRGWLEALSRTYGYQPFVLTSAAPGEPLKDGVALCRVSSWLTGTRLVSLPFSDHCDLLLDDPGDVQGFLDRLRAEEEAQDCRYVEMRPLLPMQDSVVGLQRSDSYCFHVLDIRPSLERLFANLHRDSIQRKVQRAEREGLSYERGQAADLVDEFYRLLVMTRRRHGVLPQPRAWFRNLVQCLGDRVEIRVARKNGIAIAALLTLRHRASVVYKYGCSDERSHNLGGMPFLFWKLIEDSKASGAEIIDLGRSDWDQAGLLTFKDRLGAARSPLQYYRHPLARAAKNFLERNRSKARFLFPVLPGRALSAAGGMLYKHMG